ncbi:hypothetical protein FBQ95_17250 [Chloroflexi bacterium CFX3]|nr:hypothetical protein [Chloroflexi bacterium CFX3]
MDTQNLMTLLTVLPEQIEAASLAREEAANAYAAERARVASAALSAATFAGKDGQLRAAANDTERKLAIERALAERLSDKRTTLGKLAHKKRRAERRVERLRNQFLAAQLVTKLTLAELRERSLS